MKLAFDEQALSTEGLQTLGAALQLNKSVVTIEMDNTGVRGAEVAEFLDALEKRGVQVSCRC